MPLSLTHHDDDSDAVERLTTENSTLKRRLRDLTASTRTLEDRLQAARSSNRFLRCDLALLLA